MLTDAARLTRTCRDLVEQSGLTAVSEQFFTYPDFNGQLGGVTGVVLLAESHLAVHTWPEQGNVTLDVYVCNFSADNSAKAQALLDSLIRAFSPVRSQVNRLMRGE